MNLQPSYLYAQGGIALFVIGFYALIVYPHLLRKILALNIMSSGVFLFLVATAYRSRPSLPDPVPHAMVLTGIAVSVCATGMALALALRVKAATGKMQLEEHDRDA